MQKERETKIENTASDSAELGKHFTFRIKLK